MHAKNRDGGKTRAENKLDTVDRSRHLNAEHLADMFVDDVANADCRRDFEEVRREAVVQTGWSFVLEYRPKETGHSCLRAVYHHYIVHIHGKAENIAISQYNSAYTNVASSAQ